MPPLPLPETSNTPKSPHPHDYHHSSTRDMKMESILEGEGEGEGERECGSDEEAFMWQIGIAMQELKAAATDQTKGNNNARYLVTQPNLESCIGKGKYLAAPMEQRSSQLDKLEPEKTLGKERWIYYGPMSYAPVGGWQVACASHFPPPGPSCWISSRMMPQQFTPLPPARKSRVGLEYKQTSNKKLSEGSSGSSEWWLYNDSDKHSNGHDNSRNSPDFINNLYPPGNGEKELDNMPVELVPTKRKLPDSDVKVSNRVGTQERKASRFYPSDPYSKAFWMGNVGNGKSKDTNTDKITGENNGKASGGWLPFVPPKTVYVSSCYEDNDCDNHGTALSAIATVFIHGEIILGDAPDLRGFIPINQRVLHRLTKGEHTWNPGLSKDSFGQYWHPKHDRVLHGEVKFVPDPNAGPESQFVPDPEEKSRDMCVKFGQSFIHPSALKLEYVADMCNSLIKAEKKRWLAVCPQFWEMEDYWQLVLNLED